MESFEQAASDLVEKIIGNENEFINGAAAAFKANGKNGYLAFLVERIKPYRDELINLSQSEISELINYLDTALELSTRIEPEHCDESVKKGMNLKFLYHAGTLHKAFDICRTPEVPAKKVSDALAANALFEHHMVNGRADSAITFLKMGDKDAIEVIGSYAPEFHDYIKLYPNETAHVLAECRRMICKNFIDQDKLLRETAAQPLTMEAKWGATPQQPPCLPPELIEMAQDYLGNKPDCGSHLEP